MSIQKRRDKLSRDRLEAINGEPVVLNLGCGTDDRGVGIDINYDPDIEHDLSEGIPVVDGSVDRIICHHVLEHLDNPAHLLRECERVLREDGVLDLELPNAGWLPVRLWFWRDQHTFWRHKNPDHDGHWLARWLGNDDEQRTAHRTLWTPTLLAAHLERAGLEYDIEGTHLSRNFGATAWPDSGDSGRTLHELERQSEEELASGDYWAQTRARIMCNWVDRHDPDTVLDIGCGSGYLTARIAEDRDRQVIGIDSNADSIQAARRRNCEAEFRVGDAFDLDIRSNSVDCIIFGDVLEHLAEPETALTEAGRVLRQHGVIVISVPAYRWLMGPHDEVNGHHDRYTAERLAEVAHHAGCDLERSRYTNLLPLVPYAVYQRILGKQVPSDARGGHSGLVEWMKQRAIDCEVAVPSPVGITLIAEVRQK